MLIYLYIQSISVLTKYCSSQIIQNWIVQGQIILWIRLGSVWSRWVLVRKEQTTIPGPSLVEIDSSLIEQVHCGSSSILLATFFETPSIYSSWWVPWHYVCNKHLTTSPGKDKDKEEDIYKYEYKFYHKRLCIWETPVDISKPDKELLFPRSQSCVRYAANKRD